MPCRSGRRTSDDCCGVSCFGRLCDRLDRFIVVVSVVLRRGAGGRGRKAAASAQQLACAPERAKPMPTAGGKKHCNQASKLQGRLT